MTLYEGMALIQEKQAVVLDLGTDYTKFGFTGEAAPRCIIPSEFWCSDSRRMKRVFDYHSEQELYDNLVHMLHLLYFRHVLVNPKERKVVVVESLLTPTLVRETLAKVLFMHYEVSGVMWADAGRLCALTLGAPIALVVMIGAMEAEVISVVHGVPILHALQTAPLGARAITAELHRLLLADNPHIQLTEAQLEDIKVRACFVPSRSQVGRADVRAAVYGLGSGGVVHVSGAARAGAAEPLFYQDGDMSSLPDIMLQTIAQSPIDARLALAENILVTGGTAAMPGLKARIAEEIKDLVLQHPYCLRLKIPTFKFHTAPAHDNSVAWLGGALLGAADGGARALPRDRFAQRRRLRDWPDLLHNTPPGHPHHDQCDVYKPE
ncbi:actin-related protein 10 [Aricia agestis]|uniref:actin-related protein 10 n=1 Tax=Aricia agestis TaxID=91739 RepID=UPI001C203434|nr:actin-related protein 10 [Aricia agestis]